MKLAKKEIKTAILIIACAILVISAKFMFSAKEYNADVNISEVKTSDKRNTSSSLTETKASKKRKELSQAFDSEQPLSNKELEALFGENEKFKLNIANLDILESVVSNDNNEILNIKDSTALAIREYFEEVVSAKINTENIVLKGGLLEFTLEGINLDFNVRVSINMETWQSEIK